MSETLLMRVASRNFTGKNHIDGYLANAVMFSSFKCSRMSAGRLSGQIGHIFNVFGFK